MNQLGGQIGDTGISTPDIKGTATPSSSPRDVMGGTDENDDSKADNDGSESRMPTKPTTVATPLTTLTN